MNATKTKAGATNKNKVTVAEYLSQQFDLCGKTQLEIARECGFEKPNVLTMFKQGKSKLPIARVGRMARAIGVDPLFLFQLVMSEYEPETWAEIEKLVLQQPYVSQNEMEIVQLLRMTGVPNPKVRTQEERERIMSAFSRLRPDNAVSGD
jgi:transcriptional regulator with XRE-family HTH domain